MTMNERIGDLTQTASANIQQLQKTLAQSVSARPGIPNFNASSAANTAAITGPPQQYSPLRSKTPPAEKRIADQNEAIQLQN